jgi:tRNA G18 (ribose-2'-O)-methylase SpoU
MFPHHEDGHCDMQVGLEQTADSVSLPAYAFPPRCVLVLGREKEGCPPEVLALLDDTVEIPQLGIIRSLNVHVSGAIAMYEYTKQQLSAKRRAAAA